MQNATGLSPMHLKENQDFNAIVQVMFVLSGFGVGWMLASLNANLVVNRSSSSIIMSTNENVNFFLFLSFSAGSAELCDGNPSYLPGAADCYRLLQCLVQGVLKSDGGMQNQEKIGGICISETVQVLYYKMQHNIKSRRGKSGPFDGIAI